MNTDTYFSCPDVAMSRSARARLIVLAAVLVAGTSPNEAQANPVGALASNTEVSCVLPASPIISVTSFGAVGDGVVDDTNALRAAFAQLASTGGTLRFEAGRTYKISGTLRMTDRSGFGIDGNGATLRMADGTPTSNHRMLAFEECTNFKIVNLTLDGNRANRLPAERWGSNSLNIQGGSDWTLCGVQSNNSTCDGFYINSGNNSDVATFTRRGVLQDCGGDNNFRQGLTIVNGFDIRILGGAYSFSNGTLPAAGIDLEPNSGSASPGIQDVLIRGVRLVNNEGSGIQAAGGTGMIARVTIEDSTFVNNGTNDYAGEGRAAGVRVGLSRSLMQNNMFTLHGTNIFRGIIDIPATIASEGNVIRRNTFTDNSNTESVIYVHGTSGPNNFIVDNVFLRNGGRSISNQNARSPQTRPARAPRATPPAVCSTRHLGVAGRCLRRVTRRSNHVERWGASTTRP